MQCFQLAAVVSLLLMIRAEDDDCRPMPPVLKGERKVHPRVCCNLESVMPEVIDSSFRICLQKFNMSNKRGDEAQTSVDYKPSAVPTSRGERACLGECVFNESGLLAVDREINKEAVYKVFNAAAASNKAAAPVMTAALNKCFNIHEDVTDAALDCSSGSEMLRECIVREIFLNCPGANWNASTECMELKNKHTKCPNLWTVGPQAT